MRTVGLVELWTNAHMSFMTNTIHTIDELDFFLRRFQLHLRTIHGSW